jgi:peptidase E
MNNKRIKPIFLLADSQLLFYKSEDGLFLNSLKKLIHKDADVNEIKAAYIGASNNDNPQFFEIFESAMHQIGIRNCRMINSFPEKEDIDFLKSANIILLAGGDTYKGWDVIKRNGWDEIITKKYSQGAILIGVSAGAVQLGLKGYRESIEDVEKDTGYDTLQLVPFIIDVHGDDDWLNLSKRVELEEGPLKGYGIPYGAGIIYYPDMSLEAVRYSCTEVITKDEVVLKSIILPPDKQKELDKEREI